MSSLTSHNNIFGWVNGFTITDNTVITGKARFSDNPYPAIIPNASLTQCLRNWNMADTGMLIFSALGGMLLCIPIAARASHSVLEKRAAFFKLSITSWSFGLIFGIRNSWYRLEGLAPNGLESREADSQRRIKYDYTSDFLNKSFLGLIIDSSKKQEEK